MSRIARCAVAAALVIGLVPAAAFASPNVEGVSGDEAASNASALLAQETASSEELVAVEGQALVLYRVGESDGESSGDAEGIDMLTTDSTDEAPLANAGFAVAQTWDFSAVDTAIENGAIETLSSEGASNVADGADLRIALVTREGADADALVAELEALDFVEAAQPNYLIPTSAAPNDTHYGEWRYNMTSAAAGIDLEAALAARTTSQTEGNIVAVIDTGVDYTHPDLADNMWHNPGIAGLPGSAGDAGYDFADNDADPMPGTSSSQSHGTHCAGTIAATTNNDRGVAGASSDTKIMALKANSTDDASAGLSSNATVSSYQYVIGAKLAGENVVAISNSWHIGVYLPVLDYLVNQAGKAGVLSVFAAGNQNTDTAVSDQLNATAGLESPYAIIVASSNELNTLSTFSNYNATEVDVAAPGSNILSTVSTDASAVYFEPILSHQAGRDLAYYHNFADYAENPDAYNVRLTRTDGVEITDAEQEALTVEFVEDAAYGEPGLKLTLDPEKLASPANAYQVLIVWNGENCFDAGRDATDYAAGATVKVDQQAAQSDALLYYMAGIKNANAETALSTSIGGYASFDNYAIYGTDVSEMDATCEELSYALNLIFMTEESEGIDEPMTGYVTGFGVGVVRGDGITEETSAYEPYGLMGGTSMATPTISGVVAQLVALAPDATPLELRGIVVGSTDPVTTTLQGTEKHTATDGRFSWDAALDEEPPSANTWALEADASAGTATVYGLGLSDATVAVDGAAASIVERSDGAITFATPAAAFDGGEHRVDVTDASTGKTHRASYTFPLRENAHSLEYAGTLPVGATAAATGMLAGASDRLYFGDQQGTYLYATDNPAAGTWEQLTAPGTPWAADSPDAVERSLVSYAARGTDLFAVCMDPTVDERNDYMTLHIYAAAYDAATDRWSDYAEVDAIEVQADGANGISPESLNVAANDGAIYIQVGYTLTTAEGEQPRTRLYYAPGDATAFESLLPEPTDMPEYSISNVFCDVNGLYAIAFAEVESGDGAGEAAYEIHGLMFDIEVGEWKDLGTFESAPSFDAHGYSDVARTLKTGYANGAIMVGYAFPGTGDAAYLDFSAMTWKGLGSLGTSSSDGLSVVSATAYGTRVYFTAIGDATPDAAGGIYVLPYSTVEDVYDLECASENYADVDQDAWYHEAVDWAIFSGTMTGYGNTGLFGPDDEITRAQMAQTLYNAAGAPEVTESATFTDCDESAWYAEAVAWVQDEGLFEGYGQTGLFGPDDALTREQMVTVLWRAADEPEGIGDLSAFEDGTSVGAWATEAVEWAVGEGVLNGYAGTGELRPASNMSRAEMAAVMMRAQ